MKTYLYNKNQDQRGNHEVHVSTCSHLPITSNQVYISGFHSDCRSAIQAAKRQSGKTDFDGCYYCATACHTG